MAIILHPREGVRAMPPRTRSTPQPGHTSLWEPSALSVTPLSGIAYEKILPLRDPGPWPEGFRVSREQIYDGMGHLTGGPENASGDDR